MAIASSFLTAAPVQLVDESPVASKRLEDGTLCLDFGKVAFGNLRVRVEGKSIPSLKIHFGEKQSNGRIDRKPPGTVRYAEAVLKNISGEVVAHPPAVARHNDHPGAIQTPEEWGVVLPFRWVEIENCPEGIGVEGIVRQSAYLEAWDDEAASFSCSDEMLNRIWELCRYSIKATTFAGVYVDGDRERIPYEADAYINQLCHYYADSDIQIARDTFDRLMSHPTWPTEWAPHMVFMAHADWMWNADAAWLATRYESLKGKLLMDRVGDHGLVTSSKQDQRKTDIVDWPKGERDGYVFCEINTVVNAFHLAALRKMADLAAAVGKTDEADEYRARFSKSHAAFQQRLFLPDQAMYRDGVGTDHCSLHATLFPLAFGLVPEEHLAAVVKSIAQRDMKCSVYAAQYFLEGLFEHGAGDRAISLMIADGDRSWKHMLHSGTSITWEAWDLKYKPNQDWNHAWGAAPGNLLPRYVAGVAPMAAGWDVACIRPNPGGLAHAKAKVPTRKGPLHVSWKHGDQFDIEVKLPEGVRARLELPSADENDKLWINGSVVASERKQGHLLAKELISGSFTGSVHP